MLLDVVEDLFRHAYSALINIVFFLDPSAVLDSYSQHSAFPVTIPHRHEQHSLGRVLIISH